MYLHNGKKYFSASDLANFIGCEYASYLDMIALDGRIKPKADDEHHKLLQEKGHAHERQYLESLKKQNLEIVEIQSDPDDWNARFIATKNVIQKGTDIIYQGALIDGQWLGYADFLRRVENTQAPNGFYYEVIDTKLASKATPKHLLQLCVYSELLSKLQNYQPAQMHLILGDNSQASFLYKDLRWYFQKVKSRFEEHLKSAAENIYPLPCAHCDMCRWRDYCENKWEQDNHISLVANITNSQIKKLNAIGVQNISSLAQIDKKTKVPRIQTETTERLIHQAELQNQKRQTGQSIFKLLPVAAGKGFSRLPAPDAADLYFDIEGDPLYPGGLEYLFGWCDNEKRFHYLLALNPEQEQEALAKLIQSFYDHVHNYPNAHIYHYNHYEPTALKRLCGRYGVMENELDHLLRNHKFVDLYKIVREGLRISEDSYSLKSLEIFYANKREGEVKLASDSIVYFEKYLKTNDQQLLNDILDYNKVDCISTKSLHAWLQKIAPSTISETPLGANELAVVQPPSRKPSDKKIEYFRKLELTRSLLQSLSEEQIPFKRLLIDLLDFHRREEKSSWWKHFERLDFEPEEFTDDPECIGKIRKQPTKHNSFNNDSTHSYVFPPQDIKLKKGDSVTVLAENYLPADAIIEAIDINDCSVDLKFRKSAVAPVSGNAAFKPISFNDSIKGSVLDFAYDVCVSPSRYPAINCLLKRSYPLIAGINPGEEIKIDTNKTTESITNVLLNLQSSCLFIQGPPGCGKTFTTANAIVELIKQGKKVAVSANSHKAIHNLLERILDVAKAKNVIIRAQKKASQNNPESFFSPEHVKNVISNDDIDPRCDLTAGTVFLFAEPLLVNSFDYLFIDEAGQISVANFIAMGRSARNIVLVGDQMQLAQPIQGVHPGDAGLSVLDYLLGNKATIPPNQGILLNRTYRMHPTITEFISDAIYDSRLSAADTTKSREIKFVSENNLALQPFGINLVTVPHYGNAQKSEEEAEKINQIYRFLLTQPITETRDAEALVRKTSPDDILVVSPYNMQVNLLQSILPSGARVGTVDKFQGQEAPIVIVSMATSSGSDVPRNIEFLFSKNRLNVALSRAQILSILVMSPELLSIACKTVEQMKLLNTLCHLESYAHKATIDQSDSKVA